MTNIKTCPLCQSENIKLKVESCPDYLTNKFFPLYSCLDCLNLFTGNVSNLAEHYGQNYYGSEKGKFSPFIEKLFGFNHRRHAKKFHKIFQPQTILDVGCGRAYILKELSKLGCEVFGLESADASDWIFKDSEIQVKKQEGSGSWPFPEKKFHLVIFWHVFEHMDNPNLALKEAYRVLMDKGTLCISVPASCSLQANLKLKRWFHLDVPRHIFHFSRKGLENILKQNNFTITKIEAGDLIQDLYGWFQTLTNIMIPSTPNLLYRFIQGGLPWKNCQNKWKLVILLLTSFIWIPLGLLGFLFERLLGKGGTFTIYAVKKT